MSINELDKCGSELSGNVRRSIINLKEQDVVARKKSLNQLMIVVKQEQLSPTTFEEIMHMSLKDIIRCYYDRSEANRQASISLTMEILCRCSHIHSFLPYLMEALKDRTNCVDMDGIDKLPEKLRPQPGQKPKVMLKTIENCEQIRLLYCQLIKRIISLIDKDKHEMVKHLDDIVNILRALIMDPAPDVQKAACETLQIFCKDYSDILLHFTEVMGRAVLLPLISKKSKIRIAGLNTLTSILWCGLWKYNAFVFQNLIGFRDPNSVPIKDFYEPSNSINYLATFVIDSNVKVRQEFMRHIKIWVCDLNDKYDHHSKLVPYLLSGLFDADQTVRETAMDAIVNIGKQVEEEKEKQFRENKQFAIDAAWTWEGLLVGLPVEDPVKTRPSLGSRYFVRGHVRRFWTALYKEIRDINQQNRLRSAKLALYGAIFTENYLTQFLDNMIPNLLPSILPDRPEDTRVASVIAKIFYYMGRYCEQSAYLHLMQAALDGKLIQNQQFVKCAMKGLSMQIKGNLQAIPQNYSLCHKKDNITKVLNMLQQCQIAGDVYNFNCIEARQISISILDGIKAKASPSECNEIFTVHFLTLLKLIGVSYYEEMYSSGFAMKKMEDIESSFKQNFQQFMEKFEVFESLYADSSDQITSYLEGMFCDPPSLMDSDWKILVVLYRYFCLKGPQSESYHNLFLLVQDVICECLKTNKSVQILIFTTKFLYNLILTYPTKTTESELKNSSKLLKICFMNLATFQPMKKVPIYDQHLLKEDPNLTKTGEENYAAIFKSGSNALAYYYINQIPIRNADLADLLSQYFMAFDKIRRDKECVLEATKTVWAIFEKIQMNEEIGPTFVYGNEEKKEVFLLPQVIDFAVARLEEYPDSRMSAMLFSILENVTKAMPKLKKISDKIPYVHYSYGDLIEKLLKYALDERDVETKQRYLSLMSKMAKKMPDWFKMEEDMAQKQSRFQKRKLIQQILKEANI